MPLKSGKKAIAYNIGELISTKPGKARAKGIKTLAAKRGITPSRAKQVQSIAIAYAKAKKAKK